MPCIDYHQKMESWTMISWAVTRPPEVKTFMLQMITKKTMSPHMETHHLHGKGLNSISNSSSSSSSSLLTWTCGLAGTSAVGSLTRCQSLILTAWPCITWAERCSASASSSWSRRRASSSPTYSKLWCKMPIQLRGKGWSLSLSTILGATIRSKFIYFINVELDAQMSLWATCIKH